MGYQYDQHVYAFRWYQEMYMHHEYHHAGEGNNAS